MDYEDDDYCFNCGKPVEFGIGCLGIIDPDIAESYFCCKSCYDKLTEAGKSEAIKELNEKENCAVCGCNMENDEYMYVILSICGDCIIKLRQI